LHQNSTLELANGKPSKERHSTESNIYVKSKSNIPILSFHFKGNSAKHLKHFTILSLIQSPANLNYTDGTICIKTLPETCHKGRTE